VTGGVMAFGSLFYLIFGSGKLQSWDNWSTAPTRWQNCVVMWGLWTSSRGEVWRNECPGETGDWTDLI